MSKQRRTKKEKIISQLKRQLSATNSVSKNEAPAYCQEANGKGSLRVAVNNCQIKNAKESNLSDDSGQIKKDLLKTLAMALAIISLELVLYLKLGK